MKRQAVMKACTFAFLLPFTLTALADEQSYKLADRLTKLTNQTISDHQRPIWLKNTTVKFGVANEETVWMVNTLQPVWQSRFETVFLQGKLKQRYSRMVSNIGSGYRWLTADNNLVLGLNGFYDQDVKTNAERFSIGGEAFSEDTSVRANVYNAIGELTALPDGQSLALNGYDLKLETPAPIFRNTRLSFKTYQWNTSTSIEPVQGWKTSIKTFPNNKLKVELGASSSTLAETEVFLNLTYQFGKHNKQKSAIFDKLAPQRTRVVREFAMQAEDS
ncbi:inverse autotransporter beta domain-containing protein [Sulfurirhabdus autotrophica]|uniref:Inverse autotransporter-like protein with beta domain n=1 Tax=Sulfurirhabdus autotrophica TaxID=1706046 RepID=A0A4R3YEQ3_9PROT|nr:inverse autotransporter beta domain-containing protein [Sulfurirhabdus autotrophica]TCV90560.1 inverse autotransporter-like protein with beta domain [Sulfurirhabdus autotrophica]